ncbi:MAG: metallophosphoesterase family protein [bacterium]
MRWSLFGIAVAVGALVSLFACSEKSASPSASSDDHVPTSQFTTEPNLLIAFTGDQGTDTDAVRVCELIRDEGADAYIISGDLGYDSGFPGWCSLIDQVFPAGFPVFGSVGNHDDAEWPGYQSWLLTRVDGTWTGDYGVQSSHLFRGLHFVLSGAGTMGEDADHAAYVQAEFAASSRIWKLLSMHQQMREMQVGAKGNATGWPIYENAREAGAIIITAHEHSYHRTHVLSNMSTQTVADATSPYTISPGQTFTAVSGLGGQSVRDQQRCLPTTPPYGCNGEWALIYTSDQSAKPGALFIEFFVDGDPFKAHGWFKNVDGEIVDDFIVFTEVPIATGT